MTTPTTIPTSDVAVTRLDAAYKDPVTSALYLHKDLVQVTEPWADREYLASHPGYVKETVELGDIESVVAYLDRHEHKDRPAHITWSKEGIRAVLDYHDRDTQQSGRCQWVVTYPFVLTRQMRELIEFAQERIAYKQSQAVDWLETFSPDIVDPPELELLGTLRELRTTANASVLNKVRDDGTEALEFRRDNRVVGNTVLPPRIVIRTPIYVGHHNMAGEPIAYGIQMRMRAFVGDDGGLLLRFGLVNAERAMEEAIGEMAAGFKQLATPRVVLRGNI